MSRLIDCPNLSVAVNVYVYAGLGFAPPIGFVADHLLPLSNPDVLPVALPVIVILIAFIVLPTLPCQYSPSALIAPLLLSAPLRATFRLIIDGLTY